MAFKAVVISYNSNGRSIELFLRKIFKELKIEIPVLLIPERGNQAYLMSEEAQKWSGVSEDVKRAVFLARSLQNPLRELCKISPEKLVFSDYQREISSDKLRETLEAVVTSCVCKVAVDLNKASVDVLSWLPGLDKELAQKIVDHREKNGDFKTRNDLLSVDGFSSERFEKCIGFLLLPASPQVLDRLKIHPQRYLAVEDMAKSLKLKVPELLGSKAEELWVHKAHWSNLVGGEQTFKDLLFHLKHPEYKDPRGNYKVFEFDESLQKLSDLKVGQVYKGRVSHFAPFGVFVSFGLERGGLLHSSTLGKTQLHLEDVVEVRIKSMDEGAKKIHLDLASAKRFSFGKSHGKPRKKTKGKGRKFKPKSPRPPLPQFNNPFAEALGKAKLSEKKKG